jgi:hypothetical protein
MRHLALIEWDGGVLRFPASFHKHQSYIKEARREVSADHRKSPQITANPGDAAKPAQPVAPVSSPVSGSSLLSSSPVPPDKAHPSSNGVASSSTPPAAQAPVPLRSEEPPPPPPLSDDEIEPFGLAPSVTPPPTVKRGATNRYSAVIDLVRAEGIELPTNGRDAKAVKESDASPDRIAAAYLACYRGQWAPWLRESLALHTVIPKLAGYEASQQAPPPPDRSRPVSRDGRPAPTRSGEYAQYHRMAELDRQRTLEYERQFAAQAPTQNGGHA